MPRACCQPAAPHSSLLCHRAGCLWQTVCCAAGCLQQMQLAAQSVLQLTRGVLVAARRARAARPATARAASGLLSAVAAAAAAAVQAPAAAVAEAAVSALLLRMASSAVNACWKRGLMCQNLARSLHLVKTPRRRVVMAHCQQAEVSLCPGTGWPQQKLKAAPRQRRGAAPEPRPAGGAGALPRCSVLAAEASAAWASPLAWSSLSVALRPSCCLQGAHRPCRRPLHRPRCQGAALRAWAQRQQGWALQLQLQRPAVLLLLRPPPAERAAPSLLPQPHCRQTACMGHIGCVLPRRTQSSPLRVCSAQQPTDRAWRLYNTACD